MSQVRPPAVAGLFYPADAALLRTQVAELLAAADGTAHAPLKALIVPHAGYVYSGPIEASAYARLRAQAAQIRRVVLLGPAHRVAVRGLALPGAAAFATPLGEVRLDTDAAATLRALPQVVDSPAAHALEHALEVQLPFLQQLLGEFRLLPLVVGDATADEVADVLERLWGGPETLVLVSSDLSHYLPYARAQTVDTASIEAILRLEPRLEHPQACGATPVNGLLLAARRRGMKAELFDLRNSGDTAGDRRRVVGYAALGFSEPRAARDDDDDALGEAALGHARSAIASTLGLHTAPPADHPRLAQPGATFVTLHHGAQLRGCVGSLVAHRAMRDDVRHNAHAAAFQDPRFRPLAKDDYPSLDVEVSLLSAPEPIAAADEAEALRLLRPQVDGLALEYGIRRAALLPQVWMQLPEPRAFLRTLKAKAGLPADFWASTLRLSRYTVQKWRETPRSAS